MDRIPVSAELVILWRLSAWRRPGQPAAVLEIKIQRIRPQVLAIMREMAVIGLEQDLPLVPLDTQDIAVLLSSADPRVRQFGLRLLPHAKPDLTDSP